MSINSMIKRVESVICSSVGYLICFLNGMEGSVTTTKIPPKSSIVKLSHEMRIHSVLYMWINVASFGHHFYLPSS